MFFKEVVAAISFFFVCLGAVDFFHDGWRFLVKVFLFQVYFYSTLCND